MTFGAPWGLLGLLAVPVILAIHLLRRRYTPRPIAGLFLYGGVEASPASGRKRQRLLWRRSLVLELLAALVATWFLSDLHFASTERADHLIVLLDDRARLQARPTGEETVHASLREALAAQLEALSAGDRVTLIASGDPARMLAGPATDPDTATTALAGWTATAPWHDLGDGIRLVSDLASAGASSTEGGAAQMLAQVLIVTDHVPGRLPEGVGLLARGAPAPTSGLADVRWLPAGEGRPERLVVRLVAHGGSPRQRGLVVTDATGEIARQTVQLTPGEATALVLPLPLEGVPEELPNELTVTLAAGDRKADALAVDDTVTVRRPPPRRLRIAVVVRPELRGPIERALRVQDAIEIVAAPAHLVIGDASTPAPTGDTWLLRLSPGEAAPVIGPFLTARGHPVLRGVDFTGCVWAGGAKMEALGDATELLAAGDALLMSEARSEARSSRAREVNLHIDLARSMLTEHPAWPSLFANLIAARREALPGVARTNVPLGQPVAVTAPSGARSLVIEAPDGTRATLAVRPDGTALVPALTAAGVHRLRVPTSSDADTEDPAQATWAWLVGLPLDPRMADLAAGATQTTAPAPAVDQATVSRRRGALGHLLPLVLVAAAALLAWMVFVREEETA